MTNVPAKRGTTIDLSSTPTARILHMVAIYVEMERPIPTDLIMELNLRGVIFEEEFLLP